MFGWKLPYDNEETIPMDASPPSKPVFNKLNPPERLRTYCFHNGSEMSFKDVVAIHVSSGAHWLEMKDGSKAIVMPGFRAIKLDVDDWTF
jgi:hypothetical protein